MNREVQVRFCERFKGKFLLPTRLLKNGCDMRCIQEILGHKELRTTQVYTKVEKEDLKNVLDKYHPRIFRKIK